MKTTARIFAHITVRIKGDATRMLEPERIKENINDTSIIK